MNARKERQYLIFELDDGSTVKYDLSTGVPMENLASQ